MTAPWEETANGNAKENPASWGGNGFIGGKGSSRTHSGWKPDNPARGGRSLAPALSPGYGRGLKQAEEGSFEPESALR